MAYTDIDKSDDYFNTVLWTGDGTSSRDITGVGFQPDLVWVKVRERPTSLSHSLTDSIRGVTKHLSSDTTSAESTVASRILSFDSDGFTIGSSDIVNDDTRPYVGWSWIGGGTAVSNTDGSIASTVSVNTTAGFSIVSFTGNKTAGATIGHGLGKPVDCIAIKNRIDAAQWSFYHRSLGGTQYMAFNSTSGSATASTQWNDTDPDSSVFTVGTSNNTNDTGDAMIAYCFASIKGFSKFGSYTGNGSTDGTFVYTGFKPAFILTKRTDTTSNWHMYDNKRNTFNTLTQVLFPNLSDAETTGTTTNIDALSNGFKLRGSSGTVNASGGTYIYMAFAENPFVTSTGIPTTAR